MTAERTKSKFRLGLVLDSTLVSKYGLDLVNWLQAQDQLELSHVLVLSPKQLAQTLESQNFLPPSIKSCAGSSVAKVFFRLVVGIEKLLLLKNRRHHNHLKLFDPSAFLPKGSIHQLRDDDDIIGIQALNLDLLIAFAVPAPGSSIRRAARLGMIFVSHCNDRIHRGGPAGFWEVYFRDDVTGFTIRHTTGVSDDEVVLLRGQVATQFYYLLNQASLFEKSIYYLTKLVERAAMMGDFPEPEPGVPFSDRPRGVPRVHQTLFYLMGVARLTSDKILQKATGVDFRWNVAFAHDRWRNAELWRAAIIQNPRGRYLADPFVIARDDKTFCFVEDYDQKTKRARIAVYELGQHGASYIGVALEEKFHLSFPYLFMYGGELYMCPESSENRDIRIYKCLNFPVGWALEKIIMRDIAAVDSILFEMQGKWWLLTNVDPAKWGDFSMELRIFSANSPLDEKWVPHPRNPFFIDASRTRNGGMIKEGERVFRVAQWQGFGMYGKRTTINEITILNDDDYTEKTVCVISPAFRNGIHGTHHLHSSEGWTVVDFAS